MNQQRKNLIKIHEDFRLKTTEALKQWGCDPNCQFLQRDAFNLEMAIDHCRCPSAVSIKYTPQSMAQIKETQVFRSQIQCYEIVEEDGKT
mmetsp:Transcript_12915/g.21855  ORF Transcript_12915/g.21855 Transcript_12915/m.21855 type:complete len:90 (-) Transcript_12915:95-364(-)